MIKLSNRETSMSIIPVRINNNIIMCEYAQTQKEREFGLQFRSFLPINRGMIFNCYGRYRPHFHMKNVPINLEAVFIGNNSKVIDIVPMIKMDGSFFYTTPINIPIKWVMELNKGYCKTHGIELGDYVFIY